MKKLKLLILVGCLLLIPQISIAASSASPKTETVKEQKTYDNQIEFNKKIFYLKYSHKTGKNNWLNEYYKLKEKGFGWKELICVHYFENQKDVFTYAKMLASVNEKPIFLYNKTKDSALVHIVLPGSDKKGNKRLEQNAYKIEKCDKGIAVLQFSHKYPFNTDEQQTKAIESINKYQMKYINLVDKTEIPNIVKKEIENW